VVRPDVSRPVLQENLTGPRLRHSSPTVSLHVDGVLCAPQWPMHRTRTLGQASELGGAIRASGLVAQPHSRARCVVVEWSYNCCLSRLATWLLVPISERTQCFHAFVLVHARCDRSERWPAGVSGGAHRQRQHADTATSERAGRHGRTFGSAWHGTAARRRRAGSFARSARVSRRAHGATSVHPSVQVVEAHGRGAAVSLLCSCACCVRAACAWACMQQWWLLMVNQSTARSWGRVTRNAWGPSVLCLLRVVCAWGRRRGQEK
jgi:hypothetical protein